MWFTVDLSFVEMELYGTGTLLAGCTKFRSVKLTNIRLPVEIVQEHIKGQSLQRNN
jgi:hypothetical protein